MKNRVLIGLCIFSCLFLYGCGESEQKPATAEIFAMDTVMDLTVYGKSGEDAIFQAKSLITKYDRLFSATDKNSDIYRINESAGSFVTVDSETYQLIKRSIELSELTEGAFDISIYPVVKAWGFDSKKYQIPSKEQLTKLKTLVDYQKIKLCEPNQVQIGKEMAIDLGGIAKGYTSSQIIKLFQKLSVQSAIVSLGGNVEVLGIKPDKQAYNIGVTNPLQADSLIGTIQVENEAVITSGNYERYFEKDGIRYHHIMDRNTAAPADTDLASVTVVSQDGTACDSLSTALFVMGKEKALAFQKMHPEYDLILVTKEGEVSSTTSDFKKSN